MQHQPLIFTLAVSSLACSAPSLSSDGGPKGGALDPGDAGATSSDDASATPSGTSFVRVAVLAPPLGAVDFCLRPKGATYFDGPFYFTPKIDAGAPTVAASFPGVSRYVQVPAYGETEIAIVAAGQQNCLSPKLSGSVTIDPNKRVTVALMGALNDADGGARAVDVSAFLDDTTARAKLARLRVIHAALGTEQTTGLGPLSASVAWGNTVTPIAAVVPPRGASTPSNAAPTVDALGYHDLTPITDLASLRFAALQGGGPWSTAPTDLALTDSTVHTAFVVSTPPGLSVILCTDLANGGDVGCGVYPAK